MPSFPTSLRLCLCAALLGLAGCGRMHETRMVDPRTGVVAICESSRFNLFTTAAAVAPMQACIDELGYYGFQDEARLLAATRPPQRKTPPLPSPQPMAHPPMAAPPDAAPWLSREPLDTGPFGRDAPNPSY